MDDKYYQEINPLEKEEELLSYFKEYGPKSFGKTDDGYDWIEEDEAKCIVLFNPY